MKDTIVVKDSSGVVDLCQTFTNDNTKKLLKVETNQIYFSPVVDVIKGFDENGKPYPPYTYIEIDKTEEDYEQEKEVSENG